jgi:hypothetical protein
MGYKCKAGARRGEAGLKDFSAEKYFWFGEECGRGFINFDLSDIILP